MRTSQPYRILDAPADGSARTPPDAYRVASGAAEAFLLAWSFVRVAVCSFRGLDFEGFVAFNIVVSTVWSLTSRSPLS
jgi:hypothetical protein